MKQNKKPRLPFFVLAIALLVGFLGGSTVLSNATWFNGTNYIFPDANYSSNVNVTGFLTVDKNATISDTITLNRLRFFSYSSHTGQMQIYADNDANTGIHFAGPDIISLHTGGENRLLINALGNIGIGTQTPNQKIEVNGSGNFSGVGAVVWVNGYKVCTSDGTNCPVGGSDNTSWNQSYANTLYVGLASLSGAIGQNLTYSLVADNIGNWTKDRGVYVNTSIGDTRYIRNTTIPTCSGTDKLTSAGNGVFTCATDQTGGATSTRVYIPSNVTVFSNTVITNISGAHMILTAGNWSIHCNVYFASSAATTGHVAALSANASILNTDYKMVYIGYDALVSATARQGLGANLLNTALVGTGSTGTNTTGLNYLDAEIEVLRPINLSLAHRSEISGSTVRVIERSWCEYKQVSS